MYEVEPALCMRAEPALGEKLANTLRLPGLGDTHSVSEAKPGLGEKLANTLCDTNTLCV